MVEKGQFIRKTREYHGINFNVTDFTTTVPVVYHGITPDLFQEGQGLLLMEHGMVLCLSPKIAGQA